jgi:hypothetical protein
MLSPKSVFLNHSRRSGMQLVWKQLVYSCLLCQIEKRFTHRTERLKNLLPKIMMLNELIKYPVLVCSGCYNGIPCSWWAINSTKLFLTVWRLQNPRSGCWQVTASYYLAHGECREQVVVSLLIRAPIPLMKVPLSWPNLIPKSLLPHTIALRVSTSEFGEDTKVHITAGSNSILTQFKDCYSL